MIKLNRIKVSNFKNIKEADVTFGDFNVIVGPNNSGKSNFLLVLGFLDFVFNSDISVRNDFLDSFFSESDNQLNEVEIELEYEYNFNNKWVKCHYILVVKPNPTKLNSYVEILKEELTAKERGKTGAEITIFSRENETLNFNSKVKKNHVTSIKINLSTIKVVSLLDTYMSQDWIAKPINKLLEIVESPTYYFNPNELRKDNNGNFRDNRQRRISLNPGDLYNSLSEEHKQEVDGFFKTILNVDKLIIRKGLWFGGRLENDEFPLAQRDQFYAFERYGKTYNYSGLSDGSIVIIALLVSLYSYWDLFLLEEPENSIHPKALRDLLSVLRNIEGEKQFIITTHSPIVVNMAQPEEIIVAQIGEDGSSTISNVKNPKEIRRLLRNGFSTMTDEIFFNYGKESIFETEE